MCVVEIFAMFLSLPLALLLQQQQRRRHALVGLIDGNKFACFKQNPVAFVPKIT